MNNSAAPIVKQPLGDIKTDRLSLTQFQMSDLEGLSRVFAKEEVWKYPYDRGFSRTETEAFIKAQRQEWSEYGFGCWVARLKPTGEIIGYVGLSVPHFLPDELPAVEVGWRFDPEHWKQGYAVEGAAAALTEAFETLGLDRVCSAPQSFNPTSAKVCRRLGMTFDRIAVAQGNDRRGPVDIDLYWITKAEWCERKEQIGNYRMEIFAFDHIVLCVKDVTKTVKFYSDILDLEPREERPGKWSLHFGANKISIQDAATSPVLAKKTVPGSGNFCLLTNRPILQIAEKLKANNIEILEGPDERAGATGTILSVYFRDPDGNLVEISNHVTRK